MSRATPATHASLTRGHCDGAGAARDAKSRGRPARRGEYVKGYEGMALVAQEEYTQLAALVRRNLHSDILFMKDEAFGWVEFRDVGLVNGAPVRTGRIGC